MYIFLKNNNVVPIWILKLHRLPINGKYWYKVPMPGSETGPGIFLKDLIPRLTFDINNQVFIWCKKRKLFKEEFKKIMTLNLT